MPKTINLILQDDERFPRESGIRRWGCVMRSLEAACERHVGLPLSITDILFLWGYYMSGRAMRVKNPWLADKKLAGSVWQNQPNVPLIVPASVSQGRIQFWISDMAVFATQVLHYMDSSKTVVWQPHNVLSPSSSFCLLHGTTAASRVRGWGGHWVLGHPYGDVTWDPCPSIKGFVLDGKRINFRIHD